MIQGARERASAMDLMVCPPATLIAQFAAEAQNSPLRIGAQDCHPEAAGAFTGDISAEMLKDAGASAVIVGHSERRTYHQETDAQVRAKALAVWRAGLLGIVCVGETRTEREAGNALTVVRTQAHPDTRRYCRDAWIDSRVAVLALGGEGAGDSHSLWWIGETFERGGAHGRR